MEHPCGVGALLCFLAGLIKLRSAFPQGLAITIKLFGSAAKGCTLGVKLCRALAQGSAASIEFLLQSPKLLCRFTGSLTDFLTRFVDFGA